MSHSIRDFQIRVNSLAILKTPLVVDGQDGPNTRRGIEDAKSHLNVRYQDQLFHKSGLTRVHWHWTASTYEVTDEVASHYNGVFDRRGGRHVGGAIPEDQARYSYGSRGKVGVSHTKGANTGAIGLAVAACAGREVTNWGKGIVNIGNYPMNWEMIDGMLEWTADYCKKFDIRPSPWTTITHAEVQENIGIKQNGKWDIRVLPDNPTKLLGVREGGDILRARMMEKFW